MSEINNQSDDSVNKQSSLELNSQAKTERGDNQTKQRRKCKSYSEQDAERFAISVNKAARKA